ncbi:LisH domain-containing protein C16orf63 [Salpingoeca rosetta]|uniref:Centrosomal protein 43 n=1 Tax=Salpingoeca rosetta (strain ATCC 50818 / BSB-021) TaxID=946362 RepID=F2UM44_SALR5|nr:LisH domain-containing protein C16orf63 [Salpingoeca rosetta]EGD78193.1 LisH domain-containing protein C16orf63 [Salpingoeca rosetta]|eukprot:XP_004989869.1 LisH domain-containing protein C16orf63 [Salpingoeca rosetta]
MSSARKQETQHGRGGGGGGRDTDTGDDAALRRTLKLRLQSAGVLDRLKAQFRAEVYNTLTRDHLEAVAPNLPPENYLINELIREYLEFNGYNNTHAVLVAESRQPTERLTRQHMADQVGVSETAQTQQLPLLYSMARTSTASKDSEQA